MILVTYFKLGAAAKGDGGGVMLRGDENLKFCLFALVTSRKQSSDEAYLSSEPQIVFSLCVTFGKINNILNTSFLAHYF